MEKRKQSKRNYGSPQSWPTEVAFEQALLVATGTFLVDVKELENENLQKQQLEYFDYSYLIYLTNYY